MHGSDLHYIRQQFINCFGNFGFIEEAPAPISSKVDPTTTYVGSGISTLKKYILSKIPSTGVMVDQPSMRFREIKKLFDPTYVSRYGAFFNNISLVTPSQDIDTLCEQLYAYFTNYLGIPHENLLARASSKDDELLRAAKKQFENLEIDSMPDRYYRHAIGIDGYTGCNFNIAIRNQKTGEFEDTGNLLSFEREGEHAFLEIGLGDTVIEKPLRGYKHVLDCYQLKSPATLSRSQELNFVNSVIVASVLYREGLVASNRSTQMQILQKYVKYLSMLSINGLVTFSDIAEAVSDFERGYYQDDTTVSEDIVLTLRNKEDAFKEGLEKAGLLTP